MTSPIPLNPAQERQNRAFLDALRLSGNSHAAARALGVNRSTYHKRRARHPGFAAEWDAAVSAASAAACRSLIEVDLDASDLPMLALVDGRWQRRRARPGSLAAIARNPVPRLPHTLLGVLRRHCPALGPALARQGEAGDA